MKSSQNVFLDFKSSDILERFVCELNPNDLGFGHCHHRKHQFQPQFLLFPKPFALTPCKAILMDHKCSA